MGLYVLWLLSWMCDWPRDMPVQRERIRKQLRDWAVQYVVAVSPCWLRCPILSCVALCHEVTSCDARGNMGGLAVGCMEVLRPLWISCQLAV